MIFKMTFAVTLIATALPAHAADTPPVPAVEHAVDPHIRYVDYDPDQVVRLTGYTGYQIVVEFGPDEHVETVGTGDASGWQVTPNGAGTVMFLKPVVAGRTTNLAVITNRRRYNLELIARSGARVPAARIVYALRFRYREDEERLAAAQAAPPPLTSVPQEQWNRAYSFEGARANVPEEVFDDGRATYLRFSPHQQTPAIFALADASGEAVVNSARRDGYIVIDQVAPVFVLRQGPNVTRLYNDGFAPPTPGAQAPRERVKGKHKHAADNAKAKP